jgi:DNA-binding IclR family transcriptional regulator
MSTPDESPEREQRGIQSVEVGGQLLRALAHHGRPMPLKELAREAGMAAAKAHPYLVSFGKIGLVEQDKLTGHYGLGALALQLGLISLQQADPVRLATPVLGELSQLLGHTVAIAVWGNRGPTIVQLSESPAAVHVNMRHGTVASLVHTASGRLFAAYVAEPQVRGIYEQERLLAASDPAAVKLLDWAEFKPQLDEVRRHGSARTEGGVVAGVGAMSAPVFNHQGEMVLALTAIGPLGAFDIRWNGEVAKALREAADAVSRRLGHRASPGTTPARGA